MDNYWLMSKAIRQANRKVAEERKKQELYQWYITHILGETKDFVEKLEIPRNKKA